MIKFGGLLIEMVILKLLGDCLEDSGRTNALIQANIASCRTANSFIYTSNITTTGPVHLVTAASHYTLLHKAHIEDSTSGDTHDIKPDCPYFEKWS